MTGLSKKEKGFADTYIETGNGTKSVLEHYDTESDNVAANIASENLRKPKIINYIQGQLPDELLAKKHLEGLEATTKKPHLVDRDDKGRPVYDYVEEDDYAVRHRYLDSAYKIKGSYAPDKSINLNVEAEITNPHAKELAEKYEEELKKGL